MRNRTSTDWSFPPCSVPACSRQMFKGFWGYRSPPIMVLTHCGASQYHIPWPPHLSVCLIPLKFMLSPVPDHSPHHSDAHTCRNYFLLKHVAWSSHWVIFSFYIVRDRDYLCFVSLLVVILYFLVMLHLSHLSFHPMRNAPSLVIYCGDDFSRCAWLAQGGVNGSIPMYMDGCIYGQTISREKANAKVVTVCNVLRCFELCIFSAKILLCLHHFLELLYKTLDIETLLSPDRCFWWLLFEELQGAPYSFLLLSLVVCLCLVGLSRILACFHAHWNTQIVAILLSHSCQSKA